MITHDVEIFFNELAAGLSTGISTGLTAGLFGLVTVADIITGGWLNSNFPSTSSNTEQGSDNNMSHSPRRQGGGEHAGEERVGSTVRFHSKIETLHYEQSEEEIRGNAEWSQKHKVITRHMYDDDNDDDNEGDS